MRQEPAPMASQSWQTESIADPMALLLQWLRRQAAPEAVAWLENQRAGDAKLFVTLGLASRRFPKAELRLGRDDLAAAGEARPGWDPRGWSLADAARILLLADHSRHDAGFAGVFRDLCRTADVSEAIAFYGGLPLYDRPLELEAQAAEGARSNMRVIFEAVAHRNPFPRERFDESRWNQMILKALFVGSALSPIQGLDERSNARLAAMLVDFAHERWAAGRTVSPELWRCVGPFAGESEIADMRRLLDSPSLKDRHAAILALSASPHAAARSLLAAHGDPGPEVTGEALSWERLMTPSE